MKNINNFICNCSPGVMNQKQFMEHLKTVHNIDGENIKGTRKMIMHMDGRDWYSSEYLWTLESGVIFTQYCKNKRSKNDPMYY